MRKIARSRSEVADTIERFLYGPNSPWEWDDFCSVPILDPALDVIRGRCLGLPKEFPPTEQNGYCSEAGITVLRGIIRELREPKTSGS